MVDLSFGCTRDACREFEARVAPIDGPLVKLSGRTPVDASMSTEKKHLV